MTDNEIKKVFECCAKSKVYCDDECPFYENCDRTKMSMVALDLINRQKAEIERYERENNSKFNKWKILDERTKERYADLYETAKGVVKAEAIKEFAERLKEDFTSNRYIVSFKRIDNLVKEMTEKGGEG